MLNISMICIVHCCLCTLLSVLVYFKVMYRGRPDIVFDDGMVEMAAAGPGSAVPKSKNTASQQEPTRVRVEFPETWLWSESSTGYHPMHAVDCFAKFNRHSWCICQNCLPSFIAMHRQINITLIFFLYFGPCIFRHSVTLCTSLN